MNKVIMNMIRFSQQRCVHVWHYCMSPFSVWKAFLSFNFLYCYAGWGYIVAFTKVLAMNQLYYTWIHPLHHSPLSPHPLIPETVSTGIIFAFTCMCTHFFALYSLSYLLSMSPLPTHWCQPHLPTRTCSTLLFSYFGEKKKRKEKKKNMTFWLVWDKYSYTRSFLVIFPCIYVFYPQLVYLL
jgi:hypothetical protein